MPPSPVARIAGDAELLVYDADVSRELHEASALDETSVRGAPLTAAAAYLSFAVADADGNPIVVTVDRDDERSRVALRTAITSASQAPGVTPMTLGGVATRLPDVVEIADAPIDQARADAASAMLTEEAELSRFATILDDASLITGPERAEILQLLGLAWLPDPIELAGRRHRAPRSDRDDARQRRHPARRARSTSSAPERRSRSGCATTCPTRSTSCCTRLPTTSASTWPRRPRPSPAPQSNTRVQVPVQSRVGNGEVTVQLQLRSRTLEPIGAPQAVDGQCARGLGGRRHRHPRRCSSADSSCSARCAPCSSCARRAPSKRRCCGRRRDAASDPSRRHRRADAASRARRPTRSGRTGRERHRPGERAHRRRHDRLPTDAGSSARSCWSPRSVRPPVPATPSRSRTSCRTTSTRSSPPAC